jgi:hypothetical protein
MHIRRRLSIGYALLVFIAVSPGSASFGVTRGWFGGSGNWTTGANWTPPGAPQSGDDVFIGSVGSLSTYTCNYDDASFQLKIYHAITIEESGTGAITLRQPANSLNANSMTISLFGPAEYDIEAGAASIGTVTLNPNGQLIVRQGATVNFGTVNQLGGAVLCVGNTINVNGAYNYNGGVFDAKETTGTLVTGNVSVGTLVLNSGSFGAGAIINNGFSQNVGSAMIAGDITFKAPSIVLAGGATLSAGQNVTQIGGTVTESGTFTGASGQIIGGTANITRIGGNGQWILQSGGAHSGGQLIVGADVGAGTSGVGSYSVVGDATVNFAGGIIVGQLFDGTFNQSAGQVVSGGVELGGTGSLGLAGRRGFYNLSGGSVGSSLGPLIIGDGEAISGQLTQSGGTASFNILEVNPDTTSNGQIKISGGVFQIAQTTLNNGSFSMTGGVATLTGNVDGSGSISVAGSSANLTAGRIRQDALSISGGGHVAIQGNTIGGPFSGNTNRVESLLIEKVGNTINGTLLLGSNRLIVDYAAGASPAANIRQYLTSGYNGGNWNGPGIESRNPLLHPNVTTGWDEASDALGASGGVFGGVLVDNSAILIKYTWIGDANLDGQVDVTDLGRLATHWQSAGDWSGGDFNYDGLVDVSDLGALATNWQAGVGSPLGRSLSDALSAVGLGGVSVPEPAAALMIFLATSFLCRSRSRR